MGPSVDRVQGDPSVPTATRVVVIGGGIIGVCTTFFLARKGVPVVLCEKDKLAGEQSNRNWGWGSITPGAGRLMAELVMDETPVVDPAPFRYSRFLDGTRPKPSPLA